ncbi:phage tail domain-containing protein [Bacillus sp. FSL K6-1560]|uniref:phage tail domain-containing protein n=1 Tax=Bacillus TaxID=1386 RepID=UPI000A944DE1|nr:phage tail domain-containing protein [Bacillus subtilis]QAW18038.1 phage tail family protein [Bacillus subtilis]QAW22112.1 phage tail family protein [Bacillus subtilis]
MKELDLILPDGTYISERLPGVSLLSFKPESARFERNTSNTHPLRNGLLMPRKGNKGRYAERKVVVKLLIDARNSQHFHLIRDDLSRLFTREDPFYIGYTYQPNKRWLVTGDDGFTLEQDSNKTWKEQEITLTDIQGLAESLYDTSVPFKIGNWSLGMNMGLIDKPVFTFKNKSSFEVYNFGDTEISPIEHKYNVEMYLEGKDIQILNETTGQSFTIVGSQSKKNKLTILKHYVLKGSSIITTKGSSFPSLVPGKNKFKIVNATYSQFKFITHFYYK